MLSICGVAALYASIYVGSGLPIVLPEDVVRNIISNSEFDENYSLSVDLESQKIWDSNEEVVFDFDIEPFRRHCLLNGLDDIGLTLEHEDSINDFESSRSQFGGVI